MPVFVRWVMGMPAFCLFVVVVACAVWCLWAALL